MNPKISIITAVLNSRSTILRAINSVKGQNYNKNKIEHIIIDGGSNDGTVEIIKKHRKNLKYWHSKKDKGIYDAINIGLKKCTGEIIGILNADDFFYKSTFSIVLKKRVYHNFFPEKIWYTFNICPSHSVSFFIKKKTQDKIGKYNSQFKYSADRDLFYRIIKKNLKGISTKKNEIFGKFSSNGISSRIGFFRTLLEEFKVRKSNQSFILALLIILMTALNKIYHNNSINKN